MQRGIKTRDWRDVKYEKKFVEPIIPMAERIKEVVLAMPEDIAEDVSRETYREVKNIGSGENLVNEI
jgi:hypothetical protein